MAKSTENWSKQRRIAAQRIAAVLYGVIAIMTAELAVQPSEFGYAETALGAFLAGLAMTVTRIFVEVVKKETELGSHLNVAKTAIVMGDALWVMSFPALTALMILIGALIKTRPGVLLDVVFYLSIASVFVIGFVSSYVLDRKLGPALVRGGGWLVLGLILLAAKALG
jgi:hypothetical protein